MFILPTAIAEYALPKPSIMVLSQLLEVNMHTFYKRLSLILYIIIATFLIYIMAISFMPCTAPLSSEHQVELLARAVDALCYDEPLIYQVMVARNILCSMQRYDLTLGQILLSIDEIEPSDLLLPSSARARISVNYCLYNYI